MKNKPFSDEKKIAFIDSILNKPDPPCLDLDNYKDQLISKSKGNIKIDRFPDKNNINIREVKHIFWDKENLLFKCSMQMLEKENDVWKPSIRFDDKHGFRHSDDETSKPIKHMPIGSIFEIECPILSLIIHSLPVEKSREWKLKLFNNLSSEPERFDNFFNSLS